MGLVFLAGAVLKAVDINLFVVQISHYGVVEKQALLALSALATLWVETALGTALVLRLRLKGLTFAALIVLLLVFAGLIAYGWAFHDLDDCGCFGPIEMSPRVSIAKNVVLIILGILAWCGSRRRPKPSAPKRVWPVRLAKALVCAVAASCLTCYGYSHLEAVVDPGDEGARPFAQFVFEIDGMEWDLGVGEYFVVMLNTTCEHCMESVEQLNELALIPEFPPIVGLCFEEEEGELADFREMTAPEFPLYSLGDRVRVFYSLVGEAPPRFIYARDGRQIVFWDETLPDPDVLLDAFSSQW